MGDAVCAALKDRPVAHVIYISSDAVYKDSAEPISESSCAEPGSLHGVMHLVREVMLRSEFAGPLTLVRPTLTYGIDDPHNGYGPNRFRRLAAAGKDLTLFGEGEEQRDHIAVADIAELVLCIVLHRSTGVVNAVSGEVVSFRTLAQFIAAHFTPPMTIKGSPRSGPMPHNGLRPFAPSAALRAFPGFTFTPWRKGIAGMCAETSQAKER
jgi:UDP-glucose 4-epimerase